jgi:hypothetical protein
MAERAQITSVEAVEAFRARLLVYMSKARVSVEEVGEEIKRARGWLLNEQRSHWEKELRRRSKALEEAQQELFTARLGRLQPQTIAQLMAVQRARRAVSEAEDKRDAVRRWNREFDNRVQPLVKQVEQLHTFLASDLAKGAAHLGNVLKALELYSATRPARGKDAPLAPGSSQPEAESAAEPPTGPEQSRSEDGGE